VAGSDGAPILAGVGALTTVDSAASNSSIFAPGQYSGRILMNDKLFLAGETGFGRKHRGFG
jgi:hypothetical protein